MKIAIAQQNYRVGDFDFNVLKMQSAIEKALSDGASLIVFGELSVSGYAHYDDIFYSSFLEGVNEALEKLKTLSRRMDIICGAPRWTDLESGRKFKNAAFVFQHGENTHIIDKTLLPYFDIFEEEKYYERGTNNIKPIVIQNKKILLNVCADMWAFQSPSNYSDNPIEKIAQSQAIDLMINISASPFDYLKLQNRKKIIQNITTRFNTPFLYCNLVGAYDETIFDGHSLVFNANGECVKQLKSFEEDIQIVDTEEIKTYTPLAWNPPSTVARQNDVISLLTDEEHLTSILSCLQFALSDFLSHTQAQKMIIASSGGIDSALCLAIASTVFSKDNIISLSLPSHYNLEATKLDAQKLAHNLGITHEEISIQEVLDIHKTLLRPSHAVKTLTEENLQSRIRACLAMAVANDEHALLINTSNKSELATGYGTLYGDMTGAISLLGDVFKTQVFALAQLLVRRGVPIPVSIIEREPSAELKQNQKDSDSLPPYPILDSILYFLIHQQAGFHQLIQLGFEPQTVEKTIMLFKKAHFKRKQFCPIIRVSDKAFGQGNKHLITSYFNYK